jgi:hypothetical protein
MGQNERDRIIEEMAELAKVSQRLLDQHAELTKRFVELRKRLEELKRVPQN